MFTLKKIIILSVLLTPMLSVLAVEKVEGPVSNIYEAKVPYCGIFTEGLKMGDTDANTNGEVTRLQETLYFRGYLKKQPSGVFDATTKSAIHKIEKLQTKKQRSGMVDAYIAKFLECVPDWSPYMAGYVYSPQANTTLNRNETMVISWGFSPIIFESASLTLISSANPKKTYTIVNTVSAWAGSYTWKVGKTMTGATIPDGLYTLELCEVGSKAYCTTTKKIFITSSKLTGGLTITAPGKNEVLIQQKAYTITWGPTALDTVDIDLLLGNNVQAIAKNVPAKNRSYIWYVPYPLISDLKYPLKIRISKGLVTATSPEFKTKYVSDIKVSINDLNATTFSLTDTIVIAGKGFGQKGNLILTPVDTSAKIHTTGYGSKDEQGNLYYKYASVSADGTEIILEANYFDNQYNRLKPGKYYLRVSVLDSNNEFVKSNKVMVTIK